MRSDLLLSLGRPQHDLVTLAQARRAGIGRAAWYHAHTLGLLEAVHTGVSRLAGSEQTDVQRIAAAVLATEPGSLASHLSGAFLWGAPVSGVEPVHVLVADRRRGRAGEGIVLHRPVDHRDLRPAQRSGVLCTNPVRTVLDVGAVASPDTVATVLDSFLVRRVTSVRMVRAAVAAHSRRGRRGIGPVRLVLDDWALGDKPPDSQLEVEMGRLLRDHGLPGARFHHRIATRARSYEIDFAIVSAKVVLEVDGWSYHGDRRAFARDRERDVELAALGWVTLRFTWYQVRFRPAWVADMIRRTIAGRG